MLNELVIVERGARRSGIKSVLRHPDVKDARRVPTLLVNLNQKGIIETIKPIPKQVTPWTLRDGQHNSFPFVQLKNPLWSVPVNSYNDTNRKRALNRQYNDRRNALLTLAESASFDTQAFKSWPSIGLLNRLTERRQQLVNLEGTRSDVVLATIDQFLLACDQNNNCGPQVLLREISEQIIENLKHSSQPVWIEVAIALLIGAFDKRKQLWQSSGALLFGASGKSRSIFDFRLVPDVSDALMNSRFVIENGACQTTGICALTGTKEQLLSGNFPQPNLPALGQTYLFSKNKDIPSNDRYGRFAVDSMPIGQDTAIRLSAAFEALTADERKNITWRKIPGEVPKQSDLFLAFAEGIPDAAIAESLADGDFSDEASGTHASKADSVAAFEMRTERTIQLMKSKIGNDLTKTKVRIAVFRKVDPANRKVVYADTQSADDLYHAAKNWIKGERNLPSWLQLPITQKGVRKPIQKQPPHIAPLGLIAFSKQLYSQAGTKRQEIMGLPAAEALKFFTDQEKNDGLLAHRRAGRVLRLVLGRRAYLIIGSAHALRQGIDHAKSYDYREALRTATILGISLRKLNRGKEVYMNETAFKLGQLLAAADVLHAGYCADVRDGAVPPALLGNQVFTMAQTAPIKALAVLCRRWKPYSGWAKKMVREPNRSDLMIASKNKKEQRRGWDIKRAMRHVREMEQLAADLAPALNESPINDVFRAELLLGYIAGLPKAQKENETEN